MVNGWVSVAGLGVGLLYGVLGVGSAFATPVLALLGVSGLAAVVSPLPALLPSAWAGAAPYVRKGNIDWVVARRTVVAAVPAAVLGAGASHYVDGHWLLILKGVVLLFAGWRVMVQATDSAGSRAAGRRGSLPFVVMAGAAIGFASGLLANGGGFLLTPLFIVMLGLEVTRAIGTSLLVASLITIPTLGTHMLLGGIDWSVAAWFTLGLAPGALAGGLVAQRVPAEQMRRFFGAFLVVFSLWYLARELGVLGW